MASFDISEAQLKSKQTIELPIGQTLYWDYYSFVKEHPIESWNHPTKILYGEKDFLVTYEDITAFSERFSCELTVMPEGEHFFHTYEQLDFFCRWLSSSLNKK